MSEDLLQRIERAKYLLAHADNAAMATVNTMVRRTIRTFFFIHDDALNDVYWASNPQSLHCQNALRTWPDFCRFA